MPNTSQEPPASSKAKNKDLKDNYVLCTLNIDREAMILNMHVLKTIDHIQIKVNMPITIQEPATS